MKELSGCSTESLALACVLKRYLCFALSSLEVQQSLFLFERAVETWG